MPGCVRLLIYDDIAKQLTYASGKSIRSPPLMMNLNGTDTTAVLEPTSLTMIVSGLGVVALLARRRRKARAGSSAFLSSVAGHPARSAKACGCFAGS